MITLLSIMVGFILWIAAVQVLRFILISIGILFGIEALQDL